MGSTDRYILSRIKWAETETWQTDIGNAAYLEAKTEDEKVYVTAGPEFGEKEGHIFVIDKALYGLKTSGKRWHERFSDVFAESL